MPCPDVYCQDCHKETGTCQVCKPGYKGQQCELGVYFMFYISFKLWNSCVIAIKNKFGIKMFGTYHIILINSECETGKYGVNCSKSCGSCLKQSQCHNVDGSCSEGCSAGYKGSLCTERKYHFFLHQIHFTSFVSFYLYTLDACVSFWLHVFDFAW